MGDDGLAIRSFSATFQSGAQIDWHRHDWGQLIFACSGVLWVATDSADWLVPPSRAIWLPPRVRHSMVVRGEVRLRTIYVAPARTVRLSPTQQVIEVAPLLRELILHVCKIGILECGRADHARLSELLIDLVGNARSQDLYLPMPSDRRARRLAEHLRANPIDRAGLARLATAAGASLRTLQRIFPRETGFTLEAWRQKARLLHAVHLLSIGTSVTRTAMNCGYQSLAAFILIFRGQFGVTPGRYIVD